VVINISGQVPAEAQNGMTVLEEDWIGDRTPEPVIAVVRIERDGVKLKDATQDRRATLKFTHIEPLSGSQADQARKLLEKACAKRGGDVSTPLDGVDEPDLPEGGE